jgi:hypothetical protein
MEVPEAAVLVRQMSEERMAKKAKKKTRKKASARKKAVASKSKRPSKSPAKKTARTISKRTRAASASGTRRVARTVTTAATAVPCVPASRVFRLVMDCAGQDFDVDTKLRDVFGDERRQQFCQCVSDTSRVPVGQISCGPSNTFGDVMDSITC